jgi:peptidoglycan/xylan/chitin deacetylase (PgdA/CDA1 family)
MVGAGLQPVVKAFGVPRLVRMWQRISRQRPLTVIMYHSISADGGAWAIRPDRFAEQIEYLRENYPIIRLSDAPEYLADSSGERRIAVTFDDAYTDCLESALPVLQPRSIPFSVFVPTRFIGGSNEWDWMNGGAPKLAIMNAVQLRELSRSPLAEIGSHSVDHVSMRSLPRSELERQAVDSKRTLEQLLGCAVTAFAYPYGQLRDVSRETEDAVGRAGYRIAVTTRWGSMSRADRPLALRRIWFSDQDGPQEMHAKVEGEFDWFAAKETVAFAARSLGGMRAAHTYEQRELATARSFREPPG